MTTRDEFVEALKGHIDQWNSQITEAEAKLSATSDQAQAEMQRQLESMKSARDDAQARLTEAMGKSAEEWASWQAQMETAWKDVADGFAKAWSRFT